MRWLFLACLAAPAVAECPPPPDHGAAYDTLYGQLSDAADEGEARALSGELWMLWLDAPDALAQAMLDEGMALRQMFDFNGAQVALGRLVEYCPDYAEGWNQRAFAAFLARDFDAALRDLDRALALNPRHLGALTGKGLTLLEMGRGEEAQVVLRTAVDLNPWLAERALLAEPPGVDL